MRFWRFLSNPRVTVKALIAGWSEQTKMAVRGRHVLAIQDTSEIPFETTADNRRGLGKVKKGNVHGVLLHAMMAVDAGSGICLGLVGGQVWTRQGKTKKPHRERSLSDKESERWLSTSAEAKETLAQAEMVTFISDRESDIYAHWARTPDEKAHLLVRAMHDHRLVAGGTLGEVVKRSQIADKATIELAGRANRRARKARVSLRFGSVELQRPRHGVEQNLPKGVTVYFVEIAETHTPKGVTPVRWLLLTTHPVETTADAWKIVAWYRQRWIIEQFFRLMKKQGLKIEDSQLQSADRLAKLTAIAARAAAIIIQLVQARDGGEDQLAAIAFTQDEIETLSALADELEGKTKLQKNPHRPHTLAWAAWIIAKLGGWTGYAKARPPGPITFHNGFAYFQSLHESWTTLKGAFKNV